MIDILKTRFIHWKKQTFHLLFWLLFPTIATIFIILVTTTIQEDSKVPVGVVMEEETPLALELYKEINETPLIRVVDVRESEAKQKVENHELDSAFIIQEGYEEKVRNGNRNWLIKSYSSDLSFAYTPVKEIIISYVQEETGRSKTAQIVNQLSTETVETFSWSEVTEKAKEIQSEENLLRTTFSFANVENRDQDSNVTIWNTWGIWAVLSLLSTLLLFDWVIKERNPAILSRYPFIRFSVKSYLIWNLLLYTIFFFLIDVLTAVTFQLLLEESLTIQGIALLFMYRSMVNIGAFLVALIFRQVFIYYGISFVIALFIGIISGAIIPTDGLTNRFPWLISLNPLHSFLSQDWFNPWLLLFLFIITIWRIKGVRSYA